MKNTVNYKTTTERGGKWIQRWRRLAIYMRDGFCCQYCGRDLRNAKPEEITLDHLTCHSHGGSDHESNLVTACKSCNCARRDTKWTKYATGGAIERIRRQRRRVLNVELAQELCGVHVGVSAGAIVNKLEVR